MQKVISNAIITGTSEALTYYNTIQAHISNEKEDFYKRTQIIFTVREAFKDALVVVFRQANEILIAKIIQQIHSLTEMISKVVEVYVYRGNIERGYILDRISKIVIDCQAEVISTFTGFIVSITKRQLTIIEEAELEIKKRWDIEAVCSFKPFEISKPSTLTIPSTPTSKTTDVTIPDDAECVCLIDVKALFKTFRTQVTVHLKEYRLVVTRDLLEQYSLRVESYLSSKEVAQYNKLTFAVLHAGLVSWSKRASRQALRFTFFSIASQLRGLVERAKANVIRISTSVTEAREAPVLVRILLNKYIIQAKELAQCAVQYLVQRAT